MISASVAIGTVLLFVLAILLEPEARGYGTHQQLGLPECFFLQLTGWKCPQCGMTTSFAYLVRGQAIQAWDANPCGPVLAVLLACVVLPWCLTAGVTGRSLFSDRPGLMWSCGTGVWLVVITFVWLIRLLMR